MRDSTDLLTAMKRAAVDAVKSGMPCGLYFGTVISTEPLKVQIDQKMTLTDKDLYLSTLVSEFEVEMTVEHETEDAETDSEHTHEAEVQGGGENAPTVSIKEAGGKSGHRHGYKGKKKFLVHLALQNGEQVLLIREQGGQRFFILDRLRKMEGGNSDASGDRDSGGETAISGTSD